MFIRCKESENQYIIDTDKNIVYQVCAGHAWVMKMNDNNFDSDNFIRWHPYLKEIKTTRYKPREIRKS